MCIRDRGWAALDVLRAVAQECKATATAVALAWLLAQPGMTAPIIGANSVGQLQDSLAASDLKMSADSLERLTQATAWADAE